MKCRFLCCLLLLLGLSFSAVAFGSNSVIVMAVNAEESVEMEALEVSESTSIVQDEQIEPEEPARSEPEEAPEDMQVDQTDDSGEWLEDESEYLELMALDYESDHEITLSDINWTLNSILFCIILCMSCAVVFLVCKIVYPLFRGGR